MPPLGIGLSLGLDVGKAVAAVPNPGLPASVASVAGFGDSIMAGFNASDAAHQWINIVSANLSAGTPLNAGSAGTILQNSNLSGGSPQAGNGRDRYASALLGANLKAMVFIAYGFNDARYTDAPTTVNAANYQNDLTEVVNGCIAGGYTRDRICIVSPYYITDTGLATGSAGFTGQTRAGFEAYVAAARAVAVAEGTYYFDAYSYMRDNGGASLIDVDNIHPTNAGHAVIAAGAMTATKFPSPVGTVFLNDTFTAADGTPITSHAPDIGLAWELQNGFAPATPNLINANRVWSATGSNAYHNLKAPINGANYYVEAVIDFLTANTNDSVAVCGRMAPDANTFYWARWLKSSNAFQLFKTFNGTSTQLGSNYVTTFTAGSKTLRLTMNDTTISMQVDGVTQVSVTDGAITKPGFAGMRDSGLQTATTGVQKTSIVASH